MAKRTNIERANAEADALIEEQKEAIQLGIERLNKRLEPYQGLLEKRALLQRSLNALTGGSTLTGEGTNRLTQPMVIDFLRKNPGSTPSEIAQAFDKTQATVSSHLYRGKSERYLSDESNRWYLRDPRNGINTIEDALERYDQDEEEEDE